MATTPDIPVPGATVSAEARAFPFATVWRLRAMGIWACAAAALLGSWLMPATRPAWDALDLAFFHLINGTVAWGEAAAIFWAVTGDRRFDYLSAIVVLVAYLLFIADRDRAGYRDGLALGALTVAVLVVVVAIQRESISLPRFSPSIALESYHSILAQVPWSRAKEGSNTSFPGDHATVMMIIAALWWRGLGHRAGLIMAALAVLFTLPRMAAGAHWLSDALVGGGFVTLIALMVVDTTPIGWWLYRPLRRMVGGTLDAWERIERGLAAPGRAPVHPRRQVLRGLCIGMADLVPGVSGGTMALILGVYRRLIGAIAALDREFARLLLRGRPIEAMRRIDLLFVLPIMAGIVLALAIFSRVVPLPVLLAELPEIMFGLFFGLIAASIVNLFGQVRPQVMGSYGWLALGVGLGLAVVLLVPVRTPDDAWFLFLCGVVAVTAMLIPGVSGAFVLLILGKYADAIDAIGRLDLGFLVPLAAGAVCGAIMVARSVRWLLTRFYRQTMLTVVGILGGSLLAVWPFQDWHYEVVAGKARLVASQPYLPNTFDAGEISGLVAMVVGVFAFRLLERLARRGPEAAATRLRSPE